jgi:hypothetical protein
MQIQNFPATQTSPFRQHIPRLSANKYLAFPPKPRPGPGVTTPLSPTQLPPGQTLGYKKISHSFQLIAKNLHPR